MSADGSTSVVIKAMLSNLALAVFKFGAAFITASSAMMSEAIHTLVDTVNQILMLIGIKRSKMPACEKHPLGHQRELYIFTFLVACLLFFMGGAFAVGSSIYHLIYPPATEQIIIFGHHIAGWLVNLIVLIAGFAADGSSLLTAYSEFKTEIGKRSIFDAFKRSTNASVMLVLVEDFGAVIGLTITLVGIMLSAATGLIWIDTVASLLTGVVLLVGSYILGKETYSLAVGESANKETVDGIKNIINSFEEVEHINELITINRGPSSILVIMSLDIVNDDTSKEVEELTTEIEDLVKSQYPNVDKVFVEYQSKEDSEY